MQIPHTRLQCEKLTASSAAGRAGPSCRRRVRVRTQVPFGETVKDGVRQRKGEKKKKSILGVRKQRGEEELNLFDRVYEHIC